MLLVQTLESRGYRVIEAHEPQLALQALETEPKIDLLATDVGLPGMNGRQVAEIARRLKPGIPVLFLTGYAHNAALGDEPLEPPHPGSEQTLQLPRTAGEDQRYAGKPGLAGAAAPCPRNQALPKSSEFE